MANFCFIDKKNLFPLEKDYVEVARYLGYSKISLPDEVIEKKIIEYTNDIYQVIKPSGTYEEFPLITSIEEKKSYISFADLKLQTENLAINLKDCNSVILMAATIGANVDMLIRRSQFSDSVKAAIYQACGAMFIEKTVDYINSEIKQKFEMNGFTVRPRYSPGYGDVPLTVQKVFFSLLPCSKIGLSLMDTLIMAPEKSVTAFIGIKNK